MRSAGLQVPARGQAGRGGARRRSTRSDGAPTQARTPVPQGARGHRARAPPARARAAPARRDRARAGRARAASWPACSTSAGPAAAWGRGSSAALRWLLGVLAFAVPVALVAGGAVLALRPILPARRPLRTGLLCLVAAVALALAAGTLGLGPDDPAARAAPSTRPSSASAPGAVGETLWWAASGLLGRRAAASSPPSCSPPPRCCSPARRSPACSTRPARASRTTTRRLRPLHRPAGSASRPSPTPTSW